jgi:hypothetical protein
MSLTKEVPGTKMGQPTSPSSGQAKQGDTVKHTVHSNPLPPHRVAAPAENSKHSPPTRYWAPTIKLQPSTHHTIYMAVPPHQADTTSQAAIRPNVPPKTTTNSNRRRPRPASVVDLQDLIDGWPVMEQQTRSQPYADEDDDIARDAARHHSLLIDDDDDMLPSCVGMVPIILDAPRLPSEQRGRSLAVDSGTRTSPNRGESVGPVRERRDAGVVGSIDTAIAALAAAVVSPIVKTPTTPTVKTPTVKTPTISTVKTPTTPTVKTPTTSTVKTPTTPTVKTPTTPTVKTPTTPTVKTAMTSTTPTKTMPTMMVRTKSAATVPHTMYHYMKAPSGSMRSRSAGQANRSAQSSVSSSSTTVTTMSAPAATYSTMPTVRPPPPIDSLAVISPFASQPQSPPRPGRTAINVNKPLPLDPSRLGVLPDEMPEFHVYPTRALQLLGGSKKLKSRRIEKESSNQGNTSLAVPDARQKGEKDLRKRRSFLGFLSKKSMIKS